MPLFLVQSAKWVISLPMETVSVSHAIFKTVSSASGVKNALPAKAGLLSFKASARLCLPLPRTALKTVSHAMPMANAQSVTMDFSSMREPASAHSRTVWSVSEAPSVPPV